MFDFYKSFQANAKLAQDSAVQFGAATVNFAKAVTEVNTQLAETFKTQATEAYKSMEAFKFPGLDTFTKSTAKKTAKADQE